jgi:L-xylulokinase
MGDGQPETHMPKYLLGIDNGGTMAKAALFTLDGREQAVAGRKTEMCSPRPGHTERDSDRLWQATAEAIRSVIQQAGVRATEIAAVATAGHGNGLYLVDRQGNPARPGIISTDTRAKQQVADWHARGVHRAVLPKTMQSLWPGQPAALLAWLAEHEPETLARTGWALMCKDYVRFRLTGEVAGELTDMSSTSLIDVGREAYDDDLLTTLGLGVWRDRLPPLCRPEQICGHVTAHAARETGLIEGTPVAGGLFDAAACTLASGVLRDDQLCMVAGTWSVNQFVSRKPVIEPNNFMTCRYCLPGHYMVMEASATSASNLEWFVTQFLTQSPAEPGAETSVSTPRRDGPDSDHHPSVYDLCNALVAAVPAEESRIVFLPFLYGSGESPDARACLLGMAGWHTTGHVLRAIYEGVAFGHRWHVDRLRRFGARPTAIRLTGGAARSEAWAQIFADTFQLPIEVPAATELGALGAAMVAGIAAGCFADYAEAVRAMHRIARVYEPDGGRAGLYNQKYERYQHAAAVMGGLWQELS